MVVSPLGISTGLGLEPGQLLYMERDLCFWGLTSLPVKLSCEQPPGLGAEVLGGPEGEPWVG